MKPTVGRLVFGDYPIVYISLSPKFTIFFFMYCRQWCRYRFILYIFMLSYNLVQYFQECVADMVKGKVSAIQFFIHPALLLFQDMKIHTHRFSSRFENSHVLGDWWWWWWRSVLGKTWLPDNAKISYNVRIL